MLGGARGKFFFIFTIFYPLTARAESILRSGAHGPGRARDQTISTAGASSATSAVSSGGPAE
jgi:hypothetical protein